MKSKDDGRQDKGALAHPEAGQVQGPSKGGRGADRRQDEAAAASMTCEDEGCLAQAPHRHAGPGTRRPDRRPVRREPV